jgi:hypothetical protein
MAKILTYHVLTGANADAIAGKVQNEIRNGWQPFGSLATTSTGIYVQPIVQYLPDPSETQQPV